MAKLLLVIDDDPDQRRFLERTLQAAGYRVELPDLLSTIQGLAGRE
jgi:DNA-binding NtrC family response regulator